MERSKASIPIIFLQQKLFCHVPEIKKIHLAPDDSPVPEE
jgi:hypothetical protein